MDDFSDIVTLTLFSFCLIAASPAQREGEGASRGADGERGEVEATRRRGEAEV